MGESLFLLLLNFKATFGGCNEATPSTHYLQNRPEMAKSYLIVCSGKSVEEDVALSAGSSVKETNCHMCTVLLLGRTAPFFHQ